MDFFRRFMAGRYGSDPLNNALLILGIALIIVARILGWAWMNVFILALLCLCYFRMFSRNIQARYAENEKFMRWWRPVSNRIRGARAKGQGKDYDYLPALSHQIRPKDLKLTVYYCSIYKTAVH